MKGKSMKKIRQEAFPPSDMTPKVPSQGKATCLAYSFPFEAFAPHQFPNLVTAGHLFGRVLNCAYSWVAPKWDTQSTPTLPRGCRVSYGLGMQLPAAPLFPGFVSWNRTNSERHISRIFSTLCGTIMNLGGLSLQTLSTPDLSNQVAPWSKAGGFLDTIPSSTLRQHTYTFSDWNCYEWK